MNPRPPKKRHFLLLLGVVATLASAASCKCSGEQGQTGTQAAGSATATGTAEPALAEKSFKLQNGLQVDLLEGPCGDAAALVVLVSGGSDHDPPGRSGMGQLAARLLSTEVPAGRAARTVETGSDYTLYSVVVPADRLVDEVDSVTAWMAGPPPEAAVERERTRLLEELDKLAGADAAGTALMLAEEGVQPTRGNGKRRGIAAEVKAITLAELQELWGARYRPGNARVVVAGRFDTEKVRARMEAALGPLPAGTPPALRDPPSGTVKGTLVMGDAPTAVAVAVPAPATDDPLFAPFLILAARLLDGNQGRNWQASYDPVRRPELLLITGPVGQAEQPEPAAGRMRSEAAAVLAKPLAAEDVAKAWERFRLYLEPRLTDPALCARDSRAFAIARARRAQSGLDPAAIDQALDKATKEQLDEAAKAFDTKRSAAVIAGGAIK